MREGNEDPYVCVEGYGEREENGSEDEVRMEVSRVRVCRASGMVERGRGWRAIRDVIRGLSGDPESDTIILRDGLAERTEPESRGDGGSSSTVIVPLKTDLKREPSDTRIVRKSQDVLNRDKPIQHLLPRVRANTLDTIIVQ